MNRRSLLLGLGAAVMPNIASAGQETLHDQWMENPVYRYVMEVLQEGDTSRLDEFVHPEVKIPYLGIEGIDQFALKAQRDYADRQLKYEYIQYYAFGPVMSADRAFAEVRLSLDQEIHVALILGGLKDGLIKRLIVGTNTPTPELF